MVGTFVCGHIRKPLDAHYLSSILRTPTDRKCATVICTDITVYFFFFFTGNFKAGPEPGTILKKLCPKEQLCFQVLMNDVLKPYVPEYKGHLTTDDGDRILLNFFKF